MKIKNQFQLQDANQKVLFSCANTIQIGNSTVLNFLIHHSINFKSPSLILLFVNLKAKQLGLRFMEYSIKLSQKAQRMRLVICN